MWGLVDGLWVDAWLLSGDILGEGWLLGGDLLAGDFCSKFILGDGNSKFIYFNRAMYFIIISCNIFSKFCFWSLLCLWFWESSFSAWDF